MARIVMCLGTLAVALSLGGCQTIEYGPAGAKPIARYAYHESSTNEHRYVLTITGPANAQMAVMHAMWKRRATELCGEKYSETLFRAERPTTTYGYYGGAPGAPILQGFLDCAPAVPATVTSDPP
jgi:hypothetical protein